MLKSLSNSRILSRYNSRINSNTNTKFNSKVKSNISKNISLKNNKTPKYKYTSLFKNKGYILELGKNLPKKEKAFKRNVSSKILLNKNMSKKMINNISSLKDKIDSNYEELNSTNHNYFLMGKNIIKDSYNINRIKRLNNEYNNNINNLQNDIDNLQNKLDYYNNMTDIYIRKYNDINSIVNQLKKEKKILPYEIDILENENKNLTSKCYKVNSDIIKLKNKLYELDKNKNNIGWYLLQINKLYK